MVNTDTVVVIDTAPEVLDTLPVTVRPPKSLRLNPPDPVLAKAPKLVMVLPPSRVTSPAVFPMRVPVLITPVWVTAPVRLSIVAPPKVTKPVDPVVIFPRDTVLASLIIIAAEVVLVVVSAPVKVMAPSLPSIVMVLLPASMVLPEVKLIPAPITETEPDVVVILWPRVTPADPFRETVPEDVVKVPLVARVPD